MMFRSFFLFLLVMTCAASMAFASGKVSVRAHRDSDRVRVVIEWPDQTAPAHMVRKIDDQTVEISFATEGDMSTFARSPAVPEIVDVRRVSNPGQPLRLWVLQTGPLFKRDLAVGKRVILDFAPDPRVKNTESPKPEKPDQPVPKSETHKQAGALPPATTRAVSATVPATVPVTVAPTTVPTTVSTTAPAPAPKGADTAASLKKGPDRAVEQTALDQKSDSDTESIPTPTARLVVDPIQPPVITLTSIVKIGMAAFIYNGSLWVAVDVPHFNAPPKITGKGADQLGRVKQIDTAEATVYRWKLPGDVAAIRGEGGDLLWRVVFAEEDPKKNPPTDFRRVELEGRRAVLWPLGVTKIIPMNDPDSGEKMFIGTVVKSTEYAGKEHKFREFTVPRAPIGLVIIPKVDDLTLRADRDGVWLTRPQGVSVTSSFQAETYNKLGSAVAAATAAVLPSATGPSASATGLSASATGSSTSAPGLSTPPTSAQSERDVQAVVIPTASLGPNGVVDATGKVANVLYRFDRWAMGGASSLLSNENALVLDVADRRPEDRASGFVSIAKMYLANGRGAEAVGYLRLALDSAPGLIDSPDFLGVRGAAYAVNGQYDLALQDLTNPGLDGYADIPLWRAVALGKLQDWDQAAAIPGSDPVYALQYPWAFGPDMVLTGAEILLRAAKVTESQKALAIAQPVVTNKVALKSDNPVHRISIENYNDYLNAELARQQGKKDIARGIWKKLVKSKDDKYRTRARLALTVLDFDEGKLTSEKAIDQLEMMRFSWRGDDLEMAIGMRLGEMYLAGGDYIRGLTMLRDTASLAPDTEIGKRITAEMTEQFRSLFSPENMNKIDPVDAITVFEKFGELAPVGVDANQMMINLVDRLMELDLLDRATRILQDLVDHKLVDEERVDGALRLAAVHLMNKRPDLALGVLNRAEAMIETLSDTPETKERSVRLGILRARALSESDRVDQALSVLSELPQTHADVVRLAADIAWQTARWWDAADSIRKLIAMDSPVVGKPLNDNQIENILNLAVAVNLSGDRLALSGVRDQYGAMMAQTPKAGEFDVVTRARQVSTLADRDTLTKLVSEVDMFEKFLDTFKKSNPLSKSNRPHVPESVPPSSNTSAPTTPVSTTTNAPKSGSSVPDTAPSTPPATGASATAPTTSPPDAKNPATAGQ